MIYIYVRFIRKKNGMIKRAAIYSLPEGTDHDEFWKYHTEVHPADFKKAAGPRLKKYVINRVTEVISGKPKIWALVELWFDSKEDMDEAFRNAQTLKIPGGKTIAEDFWSRITDAFDTILEEKEIEI